MGTGLGLSLSYGLITKLGGTIECRSTLGEGTEFVVRFPCVAEAPEAEEAMKPSRGFVVERAGA